MNIIEQQYEKSIGPVLRNWKAAPSPPPFVFQRIMAHIESPPSQQVRSTIRWLHPLTFGLSLMIVGVVVVSSFNMSMAVDRHKANDFMESYLTYVNQSVSPQNEDFLSLELKGD